VRQYNKTQTQIGLQTGPIFSFMKKTALDSNSLDALNIFILLVVKFDKKVA